MWTQWPDVNARNITGSFGTSELEAAYDLIAASGASAITDDLFRKGIEIFFDEGDLFTTGLCAGAFACHLALLTPPPPFEPMFSPVIAFNPDLLTEEPAMLASVLVHEGTHFQQYLDSSLHHKAVGDLTVVDTEFRAFWNAAVYWGSVRDSTPVTGTVLEYNLELAYSYAQQGEAELRALIDAVYN